MAQSSSFFRHLQCWSRQISIKIILSICMLHVLSFPLLTTWPWSVRIVLLVIDICFHLLKLQVLVSTSWFIQIHLVIMMITIFWYWAVLHAIAVNAEDAILSWLCLFDTGMVVAAASFSHCIRALQAGWRWKVLLSGSYLRFRNLVFHHYEICLLGTHISIIRLLLFP